MAAVQGPRTPLPPAAGTTGGAAVNAFRCIIEAMTQFLIHLADTRIRERVESNLAPADLALVNSYRTESIEFAQTVIETFAKLKAIYQRVQDRDRDLQIGLQSLCAQLQAIEINPMIEQCKSLMKQNAIVVQKLQKASIMTLANWFSENKYAIIAAVVGLGLILIPGTQFGIPAAVEQALAVVGGVLTGVGTAISWQNWEDDPHGSILNEMKDSLESLREKMQTLRTKMYNYSVDHETASEDANFLRNEARNLAGACGHILTLGEELETASLRAPVLQAPESSCVLM